jgi:deoxyribodipyrimidine photo-lyase
MQSGTAGHATIRLYNPIKQGQDHDPTGEFVRRWIPALRGVPDSFVHAPWLLPEDQQQAVGCLIGRDYPAPVVDHQQAVAYARARIAAVRRNPALRDEVQQVFARHGSRKRSEMVAVPRPESNQLRLF